MAAILLHAHSYLLSGTRCRIEGLQGHVQRGRNRLGTSMLHALRSRFHVSFFLLASSKLVWT
jgi:hypothetical protein